MHQSSCCLCVQGYLEIGRTTFTIIILLVRGWMVVQLWVVLQCDAHGVAGPPAASLLVQVHAYPLAVAPPCPSCPPVRFCLAAGSFMRSRCLCACVCVQPQHWLALTLAACR